MKNNIIVFCPNPYSLYTVSVCEMLHRQGVKIDAIFVKKFTINRFISEFNRDGKRLLAKIWNKLILREKAYDQHRDIYTISNLRQENDLTVRNIWELQKKYQINIIPTADFNSAEVEQKIASVSPQLAVFTGGGIIRKNIIAQCHKGIINCHMGWLPDYRGMDVVEWPLLLKDFDTLGFTTHLMDDGVDTGPILNRQKVSAKGYTTIRSLRMSYEPLMTKEMVATTLELLNDTIVPAHQEKEEGKQYFILHENLIQVAQQYLQQYNAG